MHENVAVNYREDLGFLAERFLLGINKYRGILKQVYLEEDNDNSNKHILGTKPNELLNIYNSTIMLSVEIVDNIVKEMAKVEELDKNIINLKREFEVEGENRNNAFDQGRAANPRRLDTRNAMRRDYFMDMFYISAITYGSVYIYSFMNSA
tara:strand:+ start:1382 stop:1834 length:453 start_codon:yes stop_codon:yes gene_type:complete